MKIAVIHDYADVLRGTRAYPRLQEHEVVIHTEASTDPARVGKAFGMHVVCWGREGSTARARAEGFDVAASRAAFFENADVLSLHLPKWVAKSSVIYMRGHRETRTKRSGIDASPSVAQSRPQAG